MQPPATDDWVGITADPLPVDDVYGWAVRPDCGAVVVFTGTVRDHADGRDGVHALEYEAYVEHAVPRMEAVAAEARRQWPSVGRVALVHRVGRLALMEAAVVVGISAGHRDAAFAAARYCIDALKSSVPIWKREEWADGSDWGTRAQTVGEVRA